MTRHVARARRALSMPPGVLARRVADEARANLERFSGPRRARRFDDAALLRATGVGSLPSLWNELASRPYPAVADTPGARAVANLLPGEEERVRALADAAVERRVDLLGSGPTQLDRPVDWLADFTTGLGWPPGDAHAVDYADLSRPTDVKVPWELSRLQWLLPAAQAYLLTEDARYAIEVRDLLEEWIAANPYGRTVNWAIAMESALRVVSWTYLFHAFASSEAWSEPGFRARFLRALWLHGDFTARNLERSDVNGNHYDANAAGLVFAGLFFPGERAAAWARDGWEILVGELPRQVTPDGVDFEMATAYHRLVCELFLLPALFRVRAGLGVPAEYRARLVAMTRFAAAYTRPDGTSPYWGDADDGRVLPLGGQALGDHRYLAGLVAEGLAEEPAREWVAGSRAEAAWLLGADAAGRLPDRPTAGPTPVAFEEGGVYVMRGDRDHVFLDCGPVGLAGRGGHGHNDCLAVDAVLKGVHVLSDCGSYVYTASADWRERFRSTAFHNTPMVDGEEQNRSVGSLWMLADDARPLVRRWTSGSDTDVLVASHSGYQRLPRPVTPTRKIVLDRHRHALAVEDSFAGDGDHEVSIPYHLAIGVTAESVGSGRWRLTAPPGEFVLAFADASSWDASCEEGWVSPSYGVKHPVVRLRFSRTGTLEPLVVAIAPASVGDPLSWAREALAGA